MSLLNPWAHKQCLGNACGLLASGFSSSSARRGCGLRRRFRLVAMPASIGHAIMIALPEWSLAKGAAPALPVSAAGPVARRVRPSCERACGARGIASAFPGSIFRMTFRKISYVSSREKRLRAAFSFAPTSRRGPARLAHRRRKGESTAGGSIAVGPHDVALSADGAVSGLHRAALLSGGWIDPRHLGYIIEL
jgi:hypothetical protein